MKKQEIEEKDELANAFRTYLHESGVNLNHFPLLADHMALIAWEFFRKDKMDIEEFRKNLLVEKNEDFTTVSWSTILRPSIYMPKELAKKRAIFLGMNRKNPSLIIVVREGNATPESYSNVFWEVDEEYMGKREEIAYLKGRIDECNDPTIIMDYRQELDSLLYDINELQQHNLK